MSESKSLVKVYGMPDRPTIRIVWRKNFQRNGGGQWYDFSLQLHHRGGDFSVYANKGYAENTKDTNLLSAIVRAVMTVDNGIESTEVRAFSLTINANSTSDPELIAMQVMRAAHRVGYRVEFRDDTKHL